MRKHYLWIGILFLVCQLAIPHPSEARDALASGTEDDQSQTVTGTVKDNEGNSIPGVNIVLKGTASGTITDIDGKYTMNVPDGNAVLVFSFIGFTQQEVSVANRNTINVSMAADVKALDEVVVTALGIERSTKSLGYATTKVAGEELSINRTTNPMNALQGKIAGVNISGMGAGPMGTSKIRIRGQSSINGQNNPLIIVNGTPIDNTNFGANINNSGSDTSYGNRGGGTNSDGGDAFSSINPDDIESINVLKGATASALYGSRAKDGVIMITTKSRGASKGIGVTYNLNFSDETPLDYTDYQYVYGQGENNVRPTTPNTQTGVWSFGEKIQPGMTQTLFNTPNIPYVAQKGIINQFYRHGQNVTNTISLSSTSDKGGINISFANTSTAGITPNNTFDRKTINIGYGYDLSDKLSFKGAINYSNEINKNPPVIADQDNSIPTTLLGLANTMPLSVLQANQYNPGGGEYAYSRFTNRTNPYWAMSEQKQNIRRDRIFGNISMKYDFTKWLFAQARVSEDYWSRDQDYINLPTGKASINASSIYSSAAPGYYNGVYTQDSRRFRETNVDFLLSASKEFGDFGVNITAGGNQLYRRLDVNSVQVTDFAIKGLYTVQNGRAKDAQYTLSERAVNSVYAQAEVNYKKYIYLNGTFRNDWFSTLSPANRSIPYGSISASYVFSESFTTKPNWLTSGKFRAAYAQVGSDTDIGPYNNNLYYGINANQFNGQPLANTGLTLPNPNLKPMTIDEFELGLDMRMFNNRLNVDLAVYKKITSNQIVGAQISDASGFTSTLINSGKSQNQGIELMINAVVMKTQSFSWEVTYAGAYNITKVLSLLNDTPGSNITTGTNVFNGSTQQIVGQEMGQIVGFGYRRDPAGNIVYGANGIFLPTTSQISFGSALPKWTGGLTNTFNYKGITFSFLIDYKLGNKMLSGTNFNAIREGLHQMTVPGRETGVVGVGVNQAGQPNTVVVPNAEDYWSSVRGLAVIEPAVFDGGYIKLRQITLGYDFTRFLPPGTPFKGIKLSAFANNVFIIKKWVDNIDPEAMGITSDNLVGMEAPGVPTTRSLGFNLNVKF